MTGLLPVLQLAPVPNRLVMLFDTSMSLSDPEVMAGLAVDTARKGMPKVTGRLAATLQPVFGTGFFGIYFPDRITWFLERGTNPFTMNKLAGKTIPMWIDDPTGKERRANPKAKIRVTRDGRTQVLIFRKAATKGARKTVVRKGTGGTIRTVTVPMSYPGAPGRIAKREAPAPFTSKGRVAGWVAKGNVGVRWRHPGIAARDFMNYAMADVTLWAGLPPRPLYLCDDSSFYTLIGG